MNTFVVGLLLNYCDSQRSIACIASLLYEGVDAVWVQDNSADDGVSATEIIQAYRDDGRVHVTVSERNLGFAAGMNRGLHGCRLRWKATHVLLINNDAQLLPGAMATLKKVAGDAAPAVISMDIDHAGERSGPMYYQRWTGLQRPRPMPGSFAYPSGCCLWVDIERVPTPLFDEDFFMYGEDCELGWRLGRQGAHWHHLDVCLVRHEGSASSGLGSPFYEARMVVAHLLLARKLAAFPVQASLFLVLRWPLLLARALLRSWRYRSFVPWTALRSGRRLVRELLRSKHHPET